MKNFKYKGFDLKFIFQYNSLVRTECKDIGFNQKGSFSYHLKEQFKQEVNKILNTKREN